ncbi:hypothetical protein N0V90_003369 [Kalmusia sp. IMI 367209]|nr:hypothetical protein N0V90_003369 [Kalmusia sp. IMI 367209]
MLTLHQKLNCSYSEPDQSRTPVDDVDRPWYNSTDDVEAHSEPIDYPTMLFLDPGILQYGQFDTSPANVVIPAHILHLLGDIDEVRTTADKYFAITHPWFPFISKKRFYDIYLRSSLPARPDIVLLFLAQKLITTLPPAHPQTPRTPLYHAAKHFYTDLEGSSVFSVPILQAGILLALYEVGHAIYPAAFLSISACARYAYALGINVSKAVHTRKALTMVEVEERRRVWWAIVILDRFVNIGCPGRPLATAEPSLDDLLPSDDAAWDQGVPSPPFLASPVLLHPFFLPVYTTDLHLDRDL